MSVCCVSPCSRYFFDDANKPSIVAINGQAAETPIPVLKYNQQFTVTWAPFQSGATGVAVTKVVLAAPSAMTHSFNANQRVVNLRRVSASGNQVTLLTPLDAATAPPQLYMVFVLNGKTYGPSRWIKLSAV
jgi:hypothetical protein